MAPTGRGLPIPTTSALLRFPQPSAPARKPPYRISYLLPVEMIVLARYVALRQSFSVAKIHQVQITCIVCENALGRAANTAGILPISPRAGEPDFTTSGKMLQQV